VPKKSEKPKETQTVVRAIHGPPRGRLEETLAAASEKTYRKPSATDVWPGGRDIRLFA